MSTAIENSSRPIPADRSFRGSTSSEERSHASSDREIALRIRQVFDALQMPVLRKLKVDVCRGNVTLRGQVRSYYERQVAQARARRVLGVGGVDDKISVTDRDEIVAGLP